MGKKVPEALKPAIVEVTAEFAAVMRSPLTRDRGSYLREVLAVTRAAAIGGDYDQALKGYKLIGETLGHLQQNHNHLHVHQAGAPMAEKTDAELIELIRERTEKSTPALPAPAPSPTPEPTFDQATLTDAERAEAEALLRG
jgi:hypothetical protein